MLNRPLRKNDPKIQDAISASDRPPLLPTPKMMAIGAEAANTKAITALAALSPEKSARILAMPGTGLTRSSNGIRSPRPNRITAPMVHR